MKRAPMLTSWAIRKGQKSFSELKWSEVLHLYKIREAENLVFFFPSQDHLKQQKKSFEKMCPWELTKDWVYWRCGCLFKTIELVWISPQVLFKKKKTFSLLSPYPPFKHDCNIQNKSSAVFFLMLHREQNMFFCMNYLVKIYFPYRDG